MADNIFSAFHYHVKCAEDREVVKQYANEAIEQFEKAKETAALASFGNIGDIKYTSRTAAPNGCFWCDGQTIAKADLPKVYDMLKAGDLHYVDIDTYNNVVELNGSCGFFGLDTANETFRVPLLADVYLKAGQEADEFGAESLPNITGSSGQTDCSSFTYNPKTSGAFYSNGESKRYFMGRSGESTNTLGILTLDASRSSSAYQDGAKVNPDHVKYRACVVLYSGEKELSIVNWSNHLTRLTEQLKQDLINYGAITISYEE